MGPDSATIRAEVRVPHLELASHVPSRSVKDARGVGRRSLVAPKPSAAPGRLAPCHAIGGVLFCFPPAIHRGDEIGSIWTCRDCGAATSGRSSTRRTVGGSALGSTSRRTASRSPLRALSRWVALLDPEDSPATAVPGPQWATA
jgi:hypothetical protein